MNARQQGKSQDEPGDLAGSWGLLIDQGLRQAHDTLVTLEAHGSAEVESAHEAWSLIGRAFETSASALRALKT